MTNDQMTRMGGAGINVVKFGSPLCPPCKAASNEIEQVAKEARFESVDFHDVNVADSRNAAVVSQLNIKTVPVVAIAEDGQIKHIMCGGEITASQIADQLDQQLAERR